MLRPPAWTKQLSVGSDRSRRANRPFIGSRTKAGLRHDLRNPHHYFLAGRCRCILLPRSRVAHSSRYSECWAGFRRILTLASCRRGVHVFDHLVNAVAAPGCGNPNDGSMMTHCACCRDVSCASSDDLVGKAALSRQPKGDLWMWQSFKRHRRNVGAEVPAERVDDRCPQFNSGDRFLRGIHPVEPSLARQNTQPCVSFSPTRTCPGRQVSSEAV